MGPVHVAAAAPAVTYAAAPAAVHVAAPTFTHTLPVATVKKVEVEPAKVEKVGVPAIPAVTYHAAAAPAVVTAPAVHHVAVPTVQHVQYTHHVPVAKTYTHTIPLGVQRQVYTTHHVGGVVAPAAVVAEAKVEDAAAAVVEA